MENLTQEMIALAKSLQSAEELLALAKEKGIEMTEESAKALYAHLQSGESLSDSDLQKVAGGTYEELMKPIIVDTTCTRCGRPFPLCTCH